LSQPLHERIRLLRQKKGYTQTDFTRKLGYKSVSSYNAFELGRKKRSISIEQAQIIASALGVSIDELFFGKELREPRKGDNDEEKPTRKKKVFTKSQ